MNENAKMGLIFLGGVAVGSLATYLAIKFSKKDISIDPEIEKTIKANKEFTSNKPPMEELLKKYEANAPKIEEKPESNVIEEETEPYISKEDDYGMIHSFPQSPRRLTDRELGQLDTTSYNVIAYTVTSDTQLTVVDDNDNILPKNVLIDELNLYEALVEFLHSDEASAGWVVEPVGKSDSEDNLVYYLFDKTDYTFYEMTGIDIYHYHE